MHKIKITGIELNNPTILAAGIMGVTAASLIRVAENNAGAMVTKSIGPYPKEGHPNPSLIKLETGFINAMGLPNPSYRDFEKELIIAKKGTKTPVIASVFGGTAEEFITVIEGLNSANPDAFELNLSCPHAEGYGAAIGTMPEMVQKITEMVCDAVTIPVWVKLTPNVTDIVSIGNAAEKGGADAIVAINCVRAMVIDIHSKYPILGNRSGGLSGSAIKPIAIKCVYDLYTKLNIPIIGVGGISTWEDSIEMMLAGASAIQIGSAVYDGLGVFENITTGIEGYLIKNDYKDIKEIIGLAHTII